MFGLYFIVLAALLSVSFANSKDDGVAVREFSELLKQRVGQDAEQAVRNLKDESFTQVINTTHLPSQYKTLLWLLI